MKQNSKKAGRHPKIDPTAFRCSVNFTAKEHSLLQTMHEKSGIDSLSAFIKMQVFGKTFKVHYMDDATRIFIDKLSALNARYRLINTNNMLDSHPYLKYAPVGIYYGAQISDINKKILHRIAFEKGLAEFEMYIDKSSSDYKMKIRPLPFK